MQKATLNRRLFLASATASALRGTDTKLLLPSDTPDEFHFRLMWYNPVPPIDPATYKLRVHGLVDRESNFSIAELRKLPFETQNSRLKCVQCWSARAEWRGFRFGHLVEAAKPKSGAKAVRDSVVARVPLKSASSAEDIAQLVCFLAMPASSNMTGEVVRMDAGMHLIT